ncbi:TPA: NADH-quinone oxidoreductase subunit N [Candidatus Bathyarchaeota archaeon]|nr:NADH-quinone oxidoreductase subunit N [Candidatus Bathyarchaeota archaeon]
MGLYDALTPSILLFVFALFTVPVLRIIRQHKKVYRSLCILWILTIFLIVTVAVARIWINYYASAEETPFNQTFLISNSEQYLSSSLLIDSVSTYMAVVYLTVGLISVLYSVLALRDENRFSERYLALMLMVLGSIIAATFSGDLLTLFIFWEASAAGSCLLITYKKSPESIEACFKYLVMIIMASGFIVYGLSVIYGLTGSLNFWAVREALMQLPDKRLLIMAFAFVACGYAIETAIVPFHMWLPDAYTAAQSSASAFLSAIVDQASYYVLMRVLIYILTPPLILNWPLSLAVFSALTMTIGNLFALAQTNVKRMISYVCIADIGYNLIAITSVTSLGVMGNLFFFFVGGMTTALAFMAVGILNAFGLEKLNDFSGIGRKFPLTSLSLVIAVCSFSGIPPFAGFMSKYMVFTAAIEGGMGWLAVVGVLNSLLQTGYLLRLVHYMYARPIRQRFDETLKEPRILLIPIFALVFLIVLIGVYPSIILSMIYPAAQQLGLLLP